MRRLNGTTDPSINNIIIVPGNGAGITQTFATNTDDGEHRLDGLTGVEDLYFMLVASTAGGLISDSEILAIAEEFLLTVPTDGANSIEVEPGGIVEGVDFDNGGLTGEIRGTKWNDLDGDGIFDIDEPGLPGTIVFLDENGDGLLNAGENSTTTDLAGNYAFTEIYSDDNSLAGNSFAFAFELDETDDDETEE